MNHAPGIPAVPLYCIVFANKIVKLEQCIPEVKYIATGISSTKIPVETHTNQAIWRYFVM